MTDIIPLASLILGVVGAVGVFAFLQSCRDIPIVVTKKIIDGYGLQEKIYKKKYYAALADGLSEGVYVSGRGIDKKGSDSDLLRFHNKKYFEDYINSVKRALRLTAFICFFTSFGVLLIASIVLLPFKISTSPIFLQFKLVFIFTMLTVFFFQSIEAIFLRPKRQGKAMIERIKDEINKVEGM